MANLSRTQQQTAMLGQLLKTAGGRQEARRYPSDRPFVGVVTI